MDKYPIRTAKIGDAPALAFLATQLGYPTSPAQMADRLSHLLPDNDQAIFVIDDGSGRPVAWIHVYHHWLLEEGHFAEIGGLVTGEGFRRRGLGRQLMRAAEEWARQRGCAAMLLRSNVTRTEAHEFYGNIGYTNIKTSLTFIKRLDSEGQAFPAT